MKELRLHPSARNSGYIRVPGVARCDRSCTILRRDYCKRGKYNDYCIGQLSSSTVAIQLQLSCKSLRTNRNTRQTEGLSSNNPSKRQNHHKPRFSSMDTPSDSDFDDYYDEGAQD
eukprot:g12592.t1